MQTLKRPLFNYVGNRDAKALMSLFPELVGYEQLVKSFASQLRPVYDEYISNVSSKWMACSWEMACFLYAMMVIKKPRNVLDLGSGYSSFVTRKYKAVMDEKTVIHSVDDDEFWLGKTESFLRSTGVSTESVMSWSAFHDKNQTVFDLVFNDLGTTTLRLKSVDVLINTISPQGIMILDDMHKPHYPKLISNKLEEAGFSVLSARNLTLDPLGRFASVAIRGKQRESNVVEV